MTWLLRGLAVIFGIGALVAAYVGYRLSSQPVTAKPVVATIEIVQAARPLRAGRTVGPADVTVRAVAEKPAGSFTTMDQVIGQAPVVDVAVGEALNRSHFQIAGQLVRSVHAGERAVAVKVDEVTGLGGFAQPGDRVDVLFYLRGTQETGNTSSAQVLLTDVRLLAYGEALQQGPGEGDSAPLRATDKASGRSRSHSSAVLAVPETAVARLMLAASSGSLRLALRPGPGVAASDGPSLVSLAQLAQATRPAGRRAPGKAPVPAAPAVVIHEGDTLRSAIAPSR